MLWARLYQTRCSALSAQASGTRDTTAPSSTPFLTASPLFFNFEENPPHQRFRFFLTFEMAYQSGSFSFQNQTLQSALLRYEIRTRITLSKHPLALQLQSCNSIEDFNKTLQDHAKDVREIERITKSMKAIVSIITPLSSVASLPDAVALVLWKVPIVASYSELFYRLFHLKKLYRLVLVSYSMYVPLSGLYVDFFVTPK